MVLGAIGTGATVAITIRAIDKFSKTFKSANTSLARIGKIGANVALGVAAGVAAMGIAAVKLAGDFEQTTVAFTTLLGSGEKAKVFLEELADFAKKTPFTLPGVEKSARQLLAVGFEAEDVLPVLRDIGNVASGLGLGEEGLQRLILNLGQVQAQGKLTGRELRDFAVAGIPLLDELATQLGVSTAAVQEMVSAGEIETATVLQAFNNMASEGGRFANLMEKQAETVQGRFSNLKDTVTLLGREMGTALLPVVGELADTFLTDVLPSLTPVIEAIGDFLVRAMEKVAPYLPQIAELFGELVVVVLDLFEVVAPLLEPLMEIGQALFPAILDIVKALTPSIKILVDALVPLLELLVPIVELIGSLIGGITKLHSKIFAGTTGKVLGMVGEGASLFNKNVMGVGDAIIRPNGDVIKTHPNDTLFATQNPGGMGGGVTFIVEGDLIGLDADDISRSLSDELNAKLSL